MTTIRRSRLFAAALLAWAVLIVLLSILIARFDFLHGFLLPGTLPLDDYLQRIEPGKFMLDLLLSLAGIFLFAAACLSLGLAVLRDWLKLEANDFAMVASALLTGQIFLSIIFLAILSVFGLTRQVVLVILLMAFLTGLRPAIGFIAARKTAAIGESLEKADMRLIALVIIVMALAATYSTTRLGYDAVVEYFSDAKLMAVTQQPVYAFAKDWFPVSSFHSMVLFTAVIEVFGDQAARLLPWLNGVAIAMLVWAIGSELGMTIRARAYCIALLLTSTVFVDLLGDGKVDLIATAPVLAATYWLIKSRERPSAALFVLVGALTGYAMIARAFNAFLVPLFVAALYVAWAIMDRSLLWKEVPWRHAVWTLAPWIALGAFHLWQNAQWLHDSLASLHMVASISSSVRQAQLEPTALLRYRLLYPFNVTLANSPQSGGNISPLFLGFLPLLLIRDARAAVGQRPGLLTLGIAAAAALLLWVTLYNAVMEIRYALFLWIFLFMPIAQAMDAVTAPLLSRVMRPLCTLLMLVMAARVLVIALGTYSPVDASGQAHCYDMEACSFIEPLNASAQPGARVFVLNAYRYYLRPDLFACASRADEYLKLESLARARSPEFWGQLYQSGFQYLTYDDFYADFHMGFGQLPSVKGLPAWLHVYQAASTSGGLYRIYRIEPVNPPTLPARSCVRDATGHWFLRGPDE